VENLVRDTQSSVRRGIAVGAALVSDVRRAVGGPRLRRHEGGSTRTVGVRAGFAGAPQLRARSHGLSVLLNGYEQVAPELSARSVLVASFALEAT
jgi:hypothetical protein